MNSRELFSVVVRGFGLWFLVLGVSQIQGVMQIFGVRNLNNYSWQPDWHTAVAFAAFYLVAGVALLRKPELILNFAYAAEGSPRDNSN